MAAFAAGAGFPLLLVLSGGVFALLLDCRRWCGGRVAKHRVACCGVVEEVWEESAAVARGAARVSLVVNIACGKR